MAALHHSFAITTFKSPTFCVVCKGMLFGLVRQGVQCGSCKKTCHERCTEAAPQCVSDEVLDKRFVAEILGASPVGTPTADPCSGDPDWADAYMRVLARKSMTAKTELAMLRRFYCILEGDGDAAARLQALKWALKEEMGRVVQLAENPPKRMDVTPGELLEYATQKLPEVTKLGVADMKMTKLVSDIHRLSQGVTHVVVDLYSLTGLHPISEERQSAFRKTEERTAAAVKALPIIMENGGVISEALIGGCPELDTMRSVTGFEAVVFDLQDPAARYLVFEGNGRMVALKKAFPKDLGIKLEIRLYDFFDRVTHEKIKQGILGVRAANHYSEKMES